VAVNKMDLVDWSRDRFEEVRAAFADLAGELGIGEVTCVPVSARNGDNVVRRGGASWWAGPTLLDLIKRSWRGAARAESALRLPVQTMLRDGARRLYAGRIEAGALAPGDKVRVGAQRYPATVAEVLIGGRSVSSARAGASVAVRLEEERDIARGDVIAGDGVRHVRSVIADLCWLDETAWSKGRRYRLRQGALETQALIDDIQFEYGVEDLSRRPVEGLTLNSISRVRVTARDPILGDLYADTPGVGAFVLFDPQTNQTCAAGMIREVVS
jgi:sulfate adenylyltransferase subunit 1